MKKNKLQALALSGMVAVILFGCTAKDNTKLNEKISKVYEITKIQGEYVLGERVDGKGEELNYLKEQLRKSGIEEIEVGDKIEFKWNKSDYDNYIWENFEAKKVK